MEKTALKCSSCDELIQYTDKLAAMGDAIGALAFHDSQHLEWRGQELGAIIVDYATAIKNTLSDLYETIERVYRNGDTSLLSELKSDQKTIQEGYMGLHSNLRIAREGFQKVYKFLDDNFKQLMDMADYFKEVEREISKQLMKGSKEKEAPAKASNQAEAPNPDQERSDNLKESLHNEK